MTDSTASHTRWRAWLPLVLLVVGNVLFGILLVRDYGTSSDEDNAHRYATATVAAYRRFIRHQQLPTDFGPGNLKYKGPAFYLTSEMVTRGLKRLGAVWDQTTIWHMTYFLSFQIAVISLYVLARRWMSNWAAFGAVLLFSTQPLLWGHAFINPKDIPFLGFFLATVAVGFAMVDWVAKAKPFTRQDAKSPPRFSGFRSTVTVVAGQALKGFTLPYVLAAGALLGFTTSIRVLGPLAGVLVALYAIYRIPRSLAGVLLPYFTVAAGAGYLLWPYLWADPLGHLIRSLGVMSDFPWFGDVLFEGKLLAATDLPGRYLPQMMLLQFTEPAIILFVAGAVLAAWKMFKAKTPEPFSLLVAWFVTPLLAVILAGSTVYDGFRQVFFLIPPVFICAGLALDWLFKRVEPAVLRILLLALIIAPGVYGIVSLHPYEYIYYNSLAGGVRGAFRNYDLDYWGTSYREAANYVNQVAPSNAQVVVYGPIQTFTPYARQDIKVLTPEKARSLKDKGTLALKYVVIFARQNRDLAACAGADTVKTIERDGAILAVVKKIPLGETSCQQNQ